MAWKKGSLPTSLSLARFKMGIGMIFLEWLFSESFRKNHFPFRFVSLWIWQPFPNNQNTAKILFFLPNFLVCVARCSKQDVLAHKLLRMLYDTHFVDLLSSSLFHSHAPLMVYKNPMQIFKKKKSPNDAEKWKRAHSERKRAVFSGSERKMRDNRVRMMRHE